MKRFVIFLNILFMVIGAFSIMLAMTSVMLFDAPGSENNIYLWIVFWSAVALPFTTYGSVVASLYFLYKKENIKSAMMVFLFPCMDIAIIIVAMTLIQVYCQGNFACS